MEQTNPSSPSNTNSMAKGLFPAVAPVVLILIGYIDPGKWATCFDVGARFGGDLLLFALAFNFVAVLCHYLSARITVVTGRNLTQICTQEYDRVTCFLLGAQAEISVISLDLSMVLGIALGVNMLFGLDLFTGILLTAINSMLYPLFSSLLESSKAKFFVVCLAGFTIVCYVFGILSSLPEFTSSSNSLAFKLSGESVFALMGLLGSNVMPHNFYLHSSIVQRYQGLASMSKSAWSQDNFILNFAISSGIFLVNYVLMNSAANGFYSTGVGLVSFQDTISLLEQAYKHSVIPIGLFVVLFLANQIVASSWEFCGEGAQSGEKMLHDFFNMDLPEWLHRATVRIFAVVIALFCLWHSGAEGMYHLLICTQVVVALLLPSSVIPLFRIASCRTIMGLHKISPVLEFVVLLIFMGMLGLELTFVVEMIFGESDWVGNLRWSIDNGTSISYILLLVTVFISFFIMLWLAATALKSSTTRLDSQPWNSDFQQVAPESCPEMENNDFIETSFPEEELININMKQEFTSQEETSLSRNAIIPTAKYDVNLPDTIMDTVAEPYVSNNFEVPANSSISQPEPEKSSTSFNSVAVSSLETEVSEGSFLKSSPVVNKQAFDDLKTLRNEGDLPVEKEDDGNTWEREESFKDVYRFGPSTTSDGPGSFRSLSGKSDDGGSSTGSLSRLSGLGRAARRQLAVVLDEFWGQLYDFHGQLTQEAKAKNLDRLFSGDSKPFQSLPNSDSVGKDFGMQAQPVGGRVAENLMNSSLYDNPSQQKLKNSIESAYRAQKGSTSIWSNQRHSLDIYGQSSNLGSLDAGERRYQSLRLPPSSQSSEYQPATVHGYQLASYANRAAKERSDYAFGQQEYPSQMSPSLLPNSYRESFGFALGQQLVNEQPFQNLAVPRNSVLKSDNSGYDLSAGPIGRMTNPNNVKQYHSLPDISGLSVPLRNSYLPDRNMQFDSPNTSMGFRATVGRTAYERSPVCSTGSRPVGPLAFDELSPSMAYCDAISLSSSSGARSLWYKQPFEQFGLANDTNNLGPQVVRNRSTPMTQELPFAEMESKLLQSLRHCILKLLKLEGSEWLFRENDGVDEDLIDRVATRERFVFEVESRDSKQPDQLCASQYSHTERKFGSTSAGNEAASTQLISSVPHCGEGCVWKLDLIASFGVWCIHRVLELSLMESRPELWGKYTYVLNRLQGVIDLAFFKPRTPMSPCFCLQVPASYQKRSSSPVFNGMLPPAVRPAKGKVTTASMILEVIKDVEIAISCRKGRSGTAAGDVAFPKGKENLASVLKRYKRRLSNRSVGPSDGGLNSRKP
ncbi:ethylene-insensitive protein 2.1-like [Silene latifolia]|uniref:ethylene-insensitive protein 2.1-like n=1 Tax=Silene latifolia TaxID=37657 RepID=UPI003D770BF9